jgi:uncharacterized membrane-anchored protein
MARKPAPDPSLARDLGEKAAQLVESEQGALARTLELLASFLKGLDGAAAPALS